MSTEPLADATVWGDNAPLVREILTLAETGNILKIPPSIDVDSAEIVVVNDLEAAIQAHYPVDLGYFPWEDIKEEVAGEVNGFLYERPDYRTVAPLLRSLSEHIDKTLLINLPVAYKRLAATIASDLALLLRSRATVGTGNAFCERLFHVYQQGGWPCGWEGRYPEGKLIVFVPTNTG